ncbi:hypothetical protein KFL_010040010, partial [Klebsormidium nitens]
IDVTVLPIICTFVLFASPFRPWRSSFAYHWRSGGVPAAASIPAAGVPAAASRRIGADCGEGTCCNDVEFSGIPGYCGTPCGTECCAASLNFACSGNAATCGAGSAGTEDPHFQLTGLPDDQEFTWDFHGKGNESYCMVSDTFLGMNVHMFGMPTDVSILEQRAEADNDFFEGTWMDAIGVMYFDEHGEKQSLEILLNHTQARASQGDPYIIRFLANDAAMDPFSEGEVTWTSADKSITATRLSNHFLSISIPGLLSLEVKVEKETELITEPPIYFLNFEIKTIATTPKVHGFLGQMYAPGAVEKRLNMGTLDGFHHREYVEGSDEDYLTSNLSGTDCSFNRFGMGVNNATKSDIALSAFLSTSQSSGTPGRRLLQATTTRESRGLLQAMTGESQCECFYTCDGSTPCSETCCNGVCTDVNTDPNNCGDTCTTCSFDNAAAFCLDGVCTLGACNEGYYDCNGDSSDGCETDVFNDPGHCGSCFNGDCSNFIMHAMPTCSNAFCDYSGNCDSGYGDCDGSRGNGCEMYLDGSINNCGTCGTVCNSNNGLPSCVVGSCTIECDEGIYGNCDNDVTNGCETFLFFGDPTNCGGCGVHCEPETPQCVFGICQAPFD